MTPIDDGLPCYAQLLARTDAPPGSSWGLFGPGNDLGTINFLTPQRVRDAATMIRRGTTIGLDFAIERLTVPPSHQRRGVRHVVFGNGSCHRDDRIELYCQAASHIDGLRHQRHPTHGFYNGASDEEADTGRRLGIGGWVEHGIVGRGVLIDLPRAFAAAGREPIDADSNSPITLTDLLMTLDHQGVERKPGDILMMRTGWLGWYFDDIDDTARAAIPGANLRSPGLAQDPAVLEWLWNTRVAAVVADNAGVECVPALPSSPFSTELPAGSGLLPGGMHPDLIALLGLCIGELWDLELLADDCARDGVYESFVTIKPLHLAEAVGSPANAYAIK